MAAYKALAYEAAARSGRQKGPEVDQVTARLQQVGVLLGGLLLGPHHSALQQLQGVLVASTSCLCAGGKEEGRKDGWMDG